MIEDRIEEVRDKLYVILENEEYNFNEILKISQELDELIVQYMHKKYNKTTFL